MPDTQIDVEFWFIRSKFDATIRYPRLEAPKGHRVTPIFTSFDAAAVFMMDRKWRYAFEIQACTTEPQLAEVILRLMANNYTHFALNGSVGPGSLIAIPAFVRKD